MTDRSSHRKKFLKNRKGYSGILAAVFMVLIILFLYFNVYAFMQNRNNDFQDTVSQVQQMDVDRNAEQVTVTNAIYTLQSPTNVSVNCLLKNAGPITVQIVRLWVQETNTTNYGNSSIIPNIVLQPGDSKLSSQFVNLTGVTSPTPDFIAHFVTARGNTFSPNLALEELSKFGRVGSVYVGPQYPNPVNQGAQATYSVTVRRGLLGGSFNVSLSITQLPPAVNYVFRDLTLSFQEADVIKATTLTLKVNYTAPLGSNIFAVTATNTAESNDLANGFGSLIIGGPTLRETGSIRMDWTTFRFYDFGTSFEFGRSLPPPQYTYQLPGTHYVIIAALFTNLDPDGRNITLTSSYNPRANQNLSDSVLWAFDPRIGTSGEASPKNAFLMRIVSVDAGGHVHQFTSQVLQYNVPTMIYFLSSDTIGEPDQLPDAGGVGSVLPLTLIFYGTTEAYGRFAGEYGQNIPWIAVKII